MHGTRALGVLVLVSALAGSLAAPAFAADPDSVEQPDVSLVAFLDGQPLSLKLVANYYCDDFSYPVIQCSTKPSVIEGRAALSLLAGTTYVTIYDQQNFGGAYLHVSQDYTQLITIGWNDRVGSFKAKNGETGQFFTDWLYGGSSWPFCCNVQVSTLNAYDNTFSSVYRT